MAEGFSGYESDRGGINAEQRPLFRAVALRIAVH